MLVFGIDQSFNSTALVAYDDVGIIYAECFKSNKNQNRFGQAYEITQWIVQRVNQYKPVHIALEGLAFGMRGNVTRDLGGLQYVIISHLQEVEKRQIDIVAPLTVKKFATGNGRSKKEEIIAHLPDDAAALFASLGAKKTTGLADLADAYFIATYIHNKKEVK